MPFSVKIGGKKAHRKSKICVVLIKAVKIERKWWNRLVNKPEKHRTDTLESINLERRRRLSWTMTSFSKKMPVSGKHEGAQELRTPLRKVVNIPHCPRRPGKTGLGRCSSFRWSTNEAISVRVLMHYKKNVKNGRKKCLKMN